MAASTSYCTVADPNNNYCYDVFINHRGPDVKKSFASHLYRRLISHGLRVFLDYQELQEGEGLTCQIQGAIRTASVHVAIFSPTYAESQWCLNELLLMVESRAPIIPVFYHVKPADVRWTRGEGVYARALHNLEKKRTRDSQPRHNTSKIENWRNAFSYVADIRGLDLETFNDDEGELLEKVVEAVLKKVVKTQLNVAKYPTGLDEKVTDLETTVLLQQHNGRVGITGLGGAGKTTLAIELFNRKSSNYSNSFFLFDVRENAKNSLHSLQSKLLQGLFLLDLPIDNRHQGIEILRKHLSSSQVFLVLDDVDHVDQVDALLPVDVLRPDSLVLITSRDKNVLTRSGIQESSIYNLTGLNTQHSIELFCSHAFRQPHPLPGFEDLVNNFISVCRGLPLSLKVLGGLLYGNHTKSSWECHLDKLQKTLPHDIQKSLQVSYDALQMEEKHIFLDIACFFIGQSKDTAIRIWNGSGWDGSLGFQSLLDKCLVEVDNRDYIRMHNLLRVLGRHLAKDSLPCRLWRWTNNMDDFLQQSSEATEVRGIRILPWESYDDKEYSSSDDDDECATFLRYKVKKLQLLNIGIKEDLLKCILSRVDSPKLIWLRWLNCPCSSLPPCIPMKKLRVLEVKGENLETLWQDELQVPFQLRELEICAPLSNIPKSIGQLKYLERMVMTSSSKIIVKIPEEFCCLQSLKHLQLSISEMRSLPDSFGNLTNLEQIDLSHSLSLEKLPNSFGSLIKLKHLDLSYCSNLTLSSGSFGNVSMLEYIQLTGCDKIEVLPSQIANQRSLGSLELKLKNLKEWSSANGESSGLEKLVLETPLLKMLPPSLGHDLRNLKYLELRRCQSLKRLPDSILLLNQLTKWKVEDCSLGELPFKTVEGKSETLNSIESRGQRRLSNLDSSFDKCLLRLQHLKLYNTEISEVSFPTGVCPNLQYLDIQYCYDLVEVGTLPNALIKLELTSCSKLKKIKEFRGLAKLQMLKIRWCVEVHEIPSTETLVSLEEMQVCECVKLKTIQDLAQLTELREIDVSCCYELEELTGFDNLKSLEKLQAYRCLKLKCIRGSEQLTRLRELDVSHCYELEGLLDLEHLRPLEKLWASECVKLKSIQGLPQLTQLRELNISGCWELKELPSLEHLRSLELLWASKCVKLKSIQGLTQLTRLQELEVSGCSELEEMQGVGHLESLLVLRASECVKLKSIKGLAQLIQLRELDVSGCLELEELPSLEQLRLLERLCASECVKLKSIQGLAQLTHLRELEVSGCSELEEMPGVGHLESLVVLRASKCVKLKSLWGLSRLTKLETLEVTGLSTKVFWFDSTN